MHKHVHKTQHSCFLLSAEGAKGKHLHVNAQYMEMLILVFSMVVCQCQICNTVLISVLTGNRCLPVNSSISGLQS